MLSIKSRLTLIFSTLSAVVVLPLCFVIAGLVQDTIRREGEQVARLEAEAVVARVSGRWDEDLLVNFGPPPPIAEQLRDDGRAWTLVRGDGRSLFAASGFHETFRGPVSNAPRVLSHDGVAFRVVSLPIFQDYAGTALDLPDEIYEATLGRYPDRELLRLTAEWEEPGDTDYEIVCVDEQESAIFVTEITRASDGKIEGPETSRQSLPSEIPDGFIERNFGGLRGCTCERASWTAHRGQLLLVWRGEDESGEPCAWAVNRVGEAYRMDSDGNVVESDEASRIYVTVAKEMTAERAEASAARLTILAGGIAAWLALSLVGFFVARVSMRPIREIVSRVEDLGDRMDARIPVDGVQDEVAEIQSTVNRMLDRIEDGVHRERQFLSDASHELRGPLARMRGELDLATSRRRDAEDYEQTIRRCASHVGSMQLTVESLLTLARLDSGRRVMQPTRLDLTSLAMEVVTGFAPDAVPRIAFDLAGAEGPCTAHADEALTRICVRNLLDNALRYSPRDSSVSIRLSSENGTAAIEIEDSGPGIAPDLRKRVFDRFTSGDASRTRERGGTGIGLSIVKSICDTSGITIDLRASESGGTIAALHFEANGSSTSI